MPLHCVLSVANYFKPAKRLLETADLAWQICGIINFYKDEGSRALLFYRSEGSSAGSSAGVAEARLLCWCRGKPTRLQGRGGLVLKFRGFLGRWGL